jgi:hypothetical protein
MTGQPLRSFVPFPGFGSTVNVTVGDANGDGYGDLVVGAGAGGGPHVKLFDGISGRELLSFYAYDPTFTGGVNVAAGEGLIVTGAGAGGGPHVKTFDGRTGAERLSFYAYDPLFAGGVSVGVAGGRIVTGAGPGGSPHVKAFGSHTGVELGGFYAYDPWFTGGVNVSAGPAYNYYFGTYQYYYSGTYLVTAPSEGGGPFVRVFRWDYGPTGDEVWRGMAYDPAFDGGVSVAMGNDGVVYTGAGPGGGPHVRGIRSSDGKEVLSLYAFDPGFLGGVNVG